MIYRYNGWLAIDKPLSMTSNDVVIHVRRLLGMKKIGHAGTLDPLATGLLLVAVGEATKLVSYAMELQKQYSFTLALGHETKTDDREGEATLFSDYVPTKNELLTVLGKRFIGAIVQQPPVYSALKKNGKRLCDLVRAGAVLPDIEPRTVTIHHIALDAINGSDVDFTVTCSKGTYIRSLGRDIARAVGSRGHISRLCRRSIGTIDKKMIISLDKLKFMVHNVSTKDFLLPVDAVLNAIPVIYGLGHEAITKIRCGVAVPMPSGPYNDHQRVRVVDHLGTLVAIASVDNGLLKPRRGFNLLAA